MDAHTVDKFDKLFAMASDGYPTKDFLNMLPDYLKSTKSRKDKISALITNANKRRPKRVSEDEFITLLKKLQADGRDWQSFYYLAKRFAPNKQRTEIFSDEFKYRDILQETYFCWILIMALISDPFIGRWIYNTYMTITFQSKKEEDFVKNQHQLKYDMGLSNIRTLVEINELSHDDKATVERNKLNKLNLANNEYSPINGETGLDSLDSLDSLDDRTKQALSILLGYSLITLKVSKVLGVKSKYEYNQLTDDEIHERLAKSEYLQEFIITFKNKIRSGILNSELIRNDFVTVSFIDILNKKIMTLYKKWQYCVKKYKESSEEDYDIRTNKTLELINDIRSIKNTVTSDNTFITIFNLKKLCCESKDKKSISFVALRKLFLLNDTDDINYFKQYLADKTDMTFDVDFDEDIIRFTWEDLVTLVSSFIINDRLQKTLNMYILYVGKTYEEIIQQLQIHYSELISSKEYLELYLNRYETKLSDHIKLVTIKNNKLKITNDNLNKEIVDLKKLLPKDERVTLFTLPTKPYIYIDEDTGINITDVEDAIVSMSLTSIKKNIKSKIITDESDDEFNTESSED